MPQEKAVTISRPIKILMALLIGLTVTIAGVVLTWIQVSNTELNDNNLAATQSVIAIDRLFNEARYASEQAQPLLLLPCSPEAQTELGRLAIGSEHIRIINLFYNNHTFCSSWGGTRIMKKHESDVSGYAITLILDKYISPGVPVMLLRSVFKEGKVTASMTTHRAARTLRLLSIHRPLTMRVGSLRLTSDNKLQPISENISARDFNAIHSNLYPFVVEYPNSPQVPFSSFLKEGAVSLILSVLLGTVVFTGLWKLLFHRKTPYEQLAEAINKGEIVPWYQPVVDPETGYITGVEILARQIKDDGTVLTPEHFIPLAESSDLIIPLTRSLMSRAAQELSVLLKKSNYRWHIGVNFTQAHVLDNGFIDECTSFINNFSPHSIMLTVELTEREQFNASPEMKNRLQELHEKGISIALDDFGTGYANLEYISKVHVDIIKIDRMFVKRVGQGVSGERLLSSLIDMVSILKLKIVAEGIETEEQVTWLSTHGVTWLQGFLYSPPIPIKTLSQKHLSRNWPLRNLSPGANS